MRVERRDLVDLGQRKLHFLGEGCKMRGGKMPEMILQKMQMLDQQIAPPLARTEKRLHRGERSGIDLPAFGGCARPAAAVAAGAVCLGI